MRIPQSGLKIDSPSFPLLTASISYWDITDANGSALGTTVVCGNLANEPSYDGLPVKILSGPSAGQVRTIEVHAGNTLTVAVPFTSPVGAVQQITAGTLFVILSSLGGGGGPGPAPAEGLSYYGIVDAVPGANQFTIGSLAGLGAGKFDGATNPYYAFVLRDVGGAGAAPQGEQQAITAYVTATGVFTTAAFTAAVAVGDEILILHPGTASAIPVLANLLLLMADVGDASASVLGSLYAILGNPAQNYNTMVGYEGATALANKLTAARAALLDQITALRMAELDPANIPADIDLIKGYTDTLEGAIGAIEGATTLHNKLTAARALLLDQITALRMAELDAANIPADVDTLLARLTALRAGYLDNINQAGLLQVTAARAAYLDNLIGTLASGTFSLVNNINEQDALVIAAGLQLVDIELDMNNLAQTNTVREYVQVDGVFYRQISAKIFPTDFDAGTKCVILSFTQKNSLYKITLQASVLEGAAKDVSWKYSRRDLI